MVVGHNVRISAVAIAHGNLVIKPNAVLVPAVPPAPVPDDELGAPPNETDDPVDDVLKKLRPRPLPVEAPLTLHQVDETFTVADLARVLNALGVTPRDLIAIFQSIKEQGSLHADLISQ